MPGLIVSSRYTTDSQILRQAARGLRWETLRLDGRRIPDWFDSADGRVAIFYTAPDAFDIAAQLSRTLLGCDADWTVRLPAQFRRREMRQMTLADALKPPGDAFIKHAVRKAFPAAVYSSPTLAAATRNVPPNALVHVCEPVEWSVEYRCFVLDGEVATMSPYKRYGQVIQDHAMLPGTTQSEVDIARRFAESVLESRSVDCPPAFVLDVGIINDRGWAVVEFNECWASGIYACDPKRVLDTLLGACVRSDTMTARERRWDFKRHYFTACP